MAFLEDPRLRQRWNRLSYNAGEVTENAAAGIWSFQHHYINPCVASIAASLESCTAPCLGDREERARRQRERERLQGRAEYSFDFYDDWYADDELEDGGILGGGWGGEDWDRLLAGTGSQRRHNGGGGGGGSGAGAGEGAGVQQDQPRRKRGMSYGTRGGRRKKAANQDPTIIPSTQPIGFLGRLPWKLGKTLRYKPSAADLQDHPKQHDAPARSSARGENEPLLRHGENDADDDDDDYFYSDDGASKMPPNRKRSGTTGSGDTSDSFRSRGDLFPSDGEGDEDAVPLDDEFTMVLDKVGGMDDKSSSRTRSSKGKRPASGRMSRTVSRATIDTQLSRRSSTLGMRHSSAGSVPPTPEPDLSGAPSTDDLRLEEERARQEEDAELERRRRAAAALAIEKGLRDRAAAADTDKDADKDADADAGMADDSAAEVEETTRRAPAEPDETHTATAAAAAATAAAAAATTATADSFVPARLPHFG